MSSFSERWNEACVTIRIQENSVNRVFAKFKAMGINVARKVMKKAVFDMLTELLYNTPVLTGRARAGWVACFQSLGMSAPNTSLGTGEGVGKGLSEGGVEKQESNVLLRWRIWNMVPYIVYLELGHSQQAPSGFFRIALKHMEDTLREVYTQAVREEGKA